MKICFNDEKIVYTGRWGMTENAAVTTAAGSYFDFRFTGDTAVVSFDVTLSAHPLSHVYISVDGGPRVEATIDHFMHVGAPFGTHDVRVIVKSIVEGAHARWFAPLSSKASLLSVEADSLEAPAADTRRTVEFVGDSITEGILIDPKKTPLEDGGLCRVYQDDATATYAWLTAEKLGLRPFIMGYGAVGITHGGSGAVPKVYDAYPFCFDGMPKPDVSADYIVVNHGANDRRAKAEDYTEGYAEFLALLRKLNPISKIVVLSAFCGVYPAELRERVERFNAETGDSVGFIDSAGWVPAEPLHPLRDGHKIIAERLAAELRGFL